MTEVPGSLPQLAAMLRESSLDGAAPSDASPGAVSDVWPDTGPDAGLEHALTRALAPLLPGAPAPSADLRLLLDRDLTDDLSGPARDDRSGAVLPLRVRGQRALAGALVLAVSGVGATGLSAAANTLPRPWQRQVSHFSHVHLPFDFPEPPARAGDPPLSSSAPSAPSVRTTAPDARTPDVEAPVRLTARPATPRDRTDQAVVGTGGTVVARPGAERDEQDDRAARWGGADRSGGAARTGAPARSGTAHPAHAGSGGHRDSEGRPRRTSTADDRDRGTHAATQHSGTQRDGSSHDGTGRDGVERGGDQTAAPHASAVGAPPEDGPGRDHRPSRANQEAHPGAGPGRSGSKTTPQRERDEDEQDRRTPGLDTGAATGLLDLPVVPTPGTAG